MSSLRFQFSCDYCTKEGHVDGAVVVHRWIRLSLPHHSGRVGPLLISFDLTLDLRCHIDFDFNPHVPLINRNDLF